MEAASTSAFGLPYAPSHLLERVSISQHAEVYKCTLSWGDGRCVARLCVKDLHANSSYINYQCGVLTRVSSGAEVLPSAFGIAMGMPPVLLFERVRPLNRSTHDKKSNKSEGDETLRIVTPWVEGAPLSSLIATASSTKAPFTLGYAVSLLWSIARCIERLSLLVEGTVLVHQDIKPSNVIVSQDSSPCATIIDYDTAVLLDTPGSVVPAGTRGYASPESVLGGSACATPTSDVFSFGVLACEVLTGRRPRSHSRATVLGRVNCSEFKRVLVSSTLPRDVRSLLEACLRSDSDSRPNPRELAVEMSILARRYASSQEVCIFPSELSGSCEFAAPTPFLRGDMVVPTYRNALIVR